MLNTFLAAVLGIYLAVCVCVRTFALNIILPKVNIPNLVLLSLVALVLDHYLAPNAKRCYICVAVFGALAFGLLPFAACLVTALEAVKLGIIGGAVFTAVTWLFSAMEDRLSTGPAAKLAPVLSALGLYLAAQCFMGIGL